MQKRTKAKKRKKKTSTPTIYVVRCFPKPNRYYVRKKGVLVNIENGKPVYKGKTKRGDKKKITVFGEWFW